MAFMIFPKQRSLPARNRIHSFNTCSLSSFASSQSTKTGHPHMPVYYMQFDFIHSAYRHDPSGT